MTESEHFDVLALGGGEGGKYLAWRMARSVQRVAAVERKLIAERRPYCSALPTTPLRRDEQTNRSAAGAGFAGTRRV
jgi:pyruvate/2-oxoglutarate dehydrogenase complex dihydrolipoamide dehydrogenase (E3) component